MHENLFSYVRTAATDAEGVKSRESEVESRLSISIFTLEWQILDIVFY
ncbi:hypothetical protein SAMN05720759_101179 [Fibrobacter sp. UWB12]|nr:hypothetical protein SAMN05720759_101179 [Fibrobacter sp. UWB12]